jgi:hypothetical protein
MFRPSTIRLSLLFIFALLCLGFALPQGYSQFSRPPAGGGIPRPPVGGLPPAPPTGPPTRPPGTPSHPPFNGGFGSGTPHLPSNGFGSIPRITIVHEWYCSRCRQVLGRGNTPPAVASCPNCGARFVNVQVQDGSRPPSFGTPPGSSPPPASASDVFDIIGFPLDKGPETGSANTTGSGDSEASGEDDPSTSQKSSSGFKTAVLVIGSLICVLFVVGVTGLLIWVAMKSSAKSPTRLNRRPKSFDVTINGKRSGRRDDD